MDSRVPSQAGRVIAFVSLVAIASACSATAAPPSTATIAGASPSASADTTLVADLDVGGRTMHVVCLGPIDTGRPTVIFEHGLGGDFGVWADVLTQVSQTDRGCSYDRAGAGSSERATGARTTTDQVDDLRALLAAAKVGPPYVLVGHSSGAYNVILHAAKHSQDVAGVVLVDPRPPSASRRFLEALPPESAGEPDLLHQYRAGFTSWEFDPTGNPEGLHLADSAAEIEAVGDLGSTPLIVLAATGDDGEGADLGPELAEAFEAIWVDLQEDLAGLSTAGRLEPVTDSTHDMPFDRPDAIVEAIAEIMGD